MKIVGQRYQVHNSNTHNDMDWYWLAQFALDYRLLDGLLY